MLHHHFILLADDSDSDALLTHKQLKKSRLNHPMQRVQDGAQVMAYLNGDGQYANRTLFPFPSVLLLDLHMPKVDGFQVLDWLTRQPPLHRLLVVAMSNTKEVEVIHRVYRSGAHVFISKSGKPEEFEHLAKFLDGFFNVAWSAQFITSQMNVTTPDAPVNRTEVSS